MVIEVATYQTEAHEELNDDENAHEAESTFLAERVVVDLFVPFSTSPSFTYTQEENT